MCNVLINVDQIRYKTSHDLTGSQNGCPFAEEHVPVYVSIIKKHKYSNRKYKGFFVYFDPCMHRNLKVLHKNMCVWIGGGGGVDSKSKKKKKYNKTPY